VSFQYPGSIPHLRAIFRRLIMGVCPRNEQKKEV
jgi:hypothetical protein